MGILSTAGTAIAGLATAGAGIAGTVGSAISNRNVSQLNNAFNEKMLQKQMDYNTEMYERQLGDQWKMYEDAKQYNSAGAQRERLEAAGLNAGMLMGGGNAGTVSSATSPSAQGVNPPRGAAVPTDYSGLGQIVGDAIGAASMLSQKRKTDAETYGVYIENQYKGAQELARLGNVLADTKSKEARTLTENLMRGLNAQLVKGQISLTQQQAETERFNTELRVTESVMRSQQLAFLPIQQRLQVASRVADIALRKSQKQLTDKQAMHEIDKIAETQARTVLSNRQADTELQRTSLTASQSDIASQEANFNRVTFNDRKRIIREELIRAVNNSGPDNVVKLLNGVHSYRVLRNIE